MALTAKFCAQCGATLEQREVDGRPREVCPSCGTVAYRNPIPVAACVVLNDQREVLLVKRRNDPHRGMWCIPIGFAELGETIAEAAARELREEAGIDARPVRLLDVSSHQSDYYGDLLIVTFEMTRTGGTERPGDDAVDVVYAPLEHHPPLAFSSNDAAIAACIDAHRDEWAIRDSFEHLTAGDDSALLSDPLVASIADYAEGAARSWLEDVRTNPTTVSYARLDGDELLAQVTMALSRFSRWLTGRHDAGEVRDFYRDLGRQRRAQGIPLHEVMSALTLLRKHLWNHIRSRGVWDRPIDVYRVLEMNRRIALFFDRAIHSMARGHDES